MKKVLPWILVVILIAGAHYLYKANVAKEQEIARLGQENEEVTKLRAELEEIRKSSAQQPELEKLRKDNEDVVRLRGEVQRLREQTKQLGAQLATAQAAGTQAQQAQQRLSQLDAENQQLRNLAVRGQQAQALTENTQQVLACINTLRQIDGAKQQWALENKKPANAIPTANDLSPYLPGGLHPCPSGGTYSLNDLTTAPTCSIPGHALPK